MLIYLFSILYTIENDGRKIIIGLNETDTRSKKDKISCCIFRGQDQIISDLIKKPIRDYIRINKIGSQIDLINQLSSSILNKVFRQYELPKEV